MSLLGKYSFLSFRKALGVFFFHVKFCLFLERRALSFVSSRFIERLSLSFSVGSFGVFYVENFICR